MRSWKSGQPVGHPLRLVRVVVNGFLNSMDAEFDRHYNAIRRPSIPPERLLLACLIQIFFTLHSERQLMEQLDFNLLLRRFVGLGMDEAVWCHSTPTQRPSAEVKPHAGFFQPRGGGGAGLRADVQRALQR